MLRLAIHRVKIYPVDEAIGFPNTYPLDGDLSDGSGLSNVWTSGVRVLFSRATRTTIAKRGVVLLWS